MATKVVVKEPEHHYDRRVTDPLRQHEKATAYCHSCKAFHTIQRCGSKIETLLNEPAK